MSIRLTVMRTRLMVLVQPKETSMALEGKHALITGCSRGIGRGIAIALAENGVKVAVYYFESDAAAKEMLEQFRKRGSDGFIDRGDVIRSDEISNIFHR